MKILLIPLLVIFAFSSLQSQELDSLKKYSYNILGFKKVGNKMGFEGGSGFFIRKNKKLFFITARHVVAGCINDSTKEQGFPSSMMILLPPSGGYHGDLFEISTQKFYVEIKCETVSIEPDLVAIELSDDRLSIVNSVEKFILPPLKNISEIQIFGFPGSSTYKDGSLYVEPESIHHLITSDTLFKISDKHKYNRLFFTKERKDSLDGYSGSPFFIKDNKSGKTRLAGIFVGQSLPDSPDNYLVFVEAQYLHKEIESKFQ